jgi:predicted AlkP superfamily phosphohydrolase/phosphomutase
MIRINLKDREPHGIVSSGKEYESLLDQIESDLVSLIDPLTGGPAIDKVYRMSKIYQTGPPTTLPDLVVK